MTHHWKTAGLLGGALMLAGACAGPVDNEDSTAALSEALEPASNSSDAVEASGMRPGGPGPGMGGLPGFRSGASEGFRCDSTPDITFVSVCGQDLPASVHLEWTDCQAPQGPGGMGPGAPGCMGPGPGPSGEGGMRPPPLLGQAGSPGGRPPPPGEGPGGGAGFAPSSGVVDITHSYVAPADCAGSIEDHQSVTFQISRSRTDGQVFAVQGTTSSVLILSPAAKPLEKESAVEVTREVRDASGAVLRSVHLSGATQVLFSGDPPPTRTINGSMTAEFSDGTLNQVVITNLVRPPMDECPWPVSGSIARTGPDAVTHTMNYGPSCGEASLDGASVQLPEHRPGGPGPR